MQPLELLAPARNADIGIAAIDCGADAVYIAGPDFGARKAAGNSVEDIARLCEHAHIFGARIFVTFNISVRDDELEEMHRQMLEAQAAGADAFIIRDERICGWKDITVPLHASTQCAIRDVSRARHFDGLGCRRIILERELSLETIREICKAVSCEVEFFVHGALCVCYSGDCRLSEFIDGRSADRGECIQACRSLYDLVDRDGKVLMKNKALLSLKDFNLRERLEDLADAGVMSFKVEGRLKSISYVKNVVRSYSEALDEIVRRRPEDYCRVSIGKVTGGFQPDLKKTFNRDYTELFMDGKRSQGWSSMDAPKSMGEAIGKVVGIRRKDRSNIEFRIKPFRSDLILNNGDGFAFVGKTSIVGFRGDVCNGMNVTCKEVRELREGTTIYRNIDSAFEKMLEAGSCKREIKVDFNVRISGKYKLDIEAVCEDGTTMISPFHADVETAENRERAEAMLRESLSKRVGPYCCSVASFEVTTAGGSMPLLSASTINSIRRMVISDLESYRFAKKKEICERPDIAVAAPAKPDLRGELMRSKYCIRYELGICPVHQGAADSGPLFLLNNGRRLALGFDCKNCEMTVKAAQM